MRDQSEIRMTNAFVIQCCYVILDPCWNVDSTTAFHVHVYSSKLTAKNHRLQIILFINVIYSRLQNAQMSLKYLQWSKWENKTTNWTFINLYRLLKQLDYMSACVALGALWPMPSKHRHYNYYETETDTENKIHKSKTAVISEIGTCLWTMWYHDPWWA